MRLMQLVLHLQTCAVRTRSDLEVDPGVPGGLQLLFRKKCVLVGFTIKGTRSAHTYDKLWAMPFTQHSCHTCHWYIHRSVRTTLSRS